MLTGGACAQYANIATVTQTTPRGSELPGSSDIPLSMRAAVLIERGRIAVQERSVPTPGPGDVLVAVTAVGVCGSDAHYYREGRIGDFVVEGPLVLGHEAAGRIVAVGDGIDRARVGERVSIEPQRPDPASAETLRGEYNLCPHMRFYATPPVDGALADYVTIGAAFAHRVPESVSDTAAALLEPTSVAIATLRKAAIGAGSSLLIAGAGPIGLMCAQVARAMGATRIVVSDPDERRRENGLRFGATGVIAPDAVADVEHVDAFVDASGAPPAIVDGMRRVRPAGRVVLVGMGPDSVALPLGVIQNRELVVTGVFRYANTWPAAIELAAAGRIDLDGMVTGRFGLDQADQALDADRTPGSIKAVIDVAGDPR